MGIYRQPPQPQQNAARVVQSVDNPPFCGALRTATQLSVRAWWTVPEPRQRVLGIVQPGIPPDDPPFSSPRIWPRVVLTWWEPPFRMPRFAPDLVQAGPLTIVGTPWQLNTGGYLATQELNTAGVIAAQELNTDGILAAKELNTGGVVDTQELNTDGISVGS